MYSGMCDCQIEYDKQFSPSIPLVWQRQTVQPQIRCHRMAASDQGPHSLLTICSMTILMKKERYMGTATQLFQPKCTDPIDKSGKFQSAYMGQ